MNSITNYDKMKSAIITAQRVDDVKEIRDKAEALRQYAKQVGESLENQNAMAEIKLRAERRSGELLSEMERGKSNPNGVNQHVEVPRHDVGEPQSEYTHALAENNINERTAQRWQRIAKISPYEFERHIADVKSDGEELTTSGMLRLAAGKPHVSNNSGENEWYTPSAYIEAARHIMGGIDIDPASSSTANETVRADTFFTIDDDGLSKPWNGRVWMNPPYSQPEIRLFSSKLVEQVENGNCAEFMTLTNNATETAWFQELLSIASHGCLLKGRIKFLSPGKEIGAPLQGQVILYRGENSGKFVQSMRDFGRVISIL